MKTLQKFSPEYLEQCKKMKPEQILKFQDDFRKLHGANKSDSTELISLRVPKALLDSFKARAEMENLRYQTQIKALMQAWVLGKN